MSDTMPSDRESGLPPLTVAVPVFNRERELVRLLDSLDRQDWRFFEVRFCDDGSTDGTRRVLDAFAAKHLGKAFVETRENAGPGPSRNRLLGQIRTEYVWFCDSDDELAPGAIARIAEILDRSPCDILAFDYGQGPCPDDAGKTRLDSPDVAVTRAQLLLFLRAASVAKVFRVEPLRKGGVEFPPLRVCEDGVFAAEAVCRCGSFRFWGGVPYWVHNGFWAKSGEDHLTKRVDDAFCENLVDAIERILAVRNRCPAERMEFDVFVWNVAANLRDRLRNDASPDVREKWHPVAQRFLEDLLRNHDNPLLRFPARIAFLVSSLKKTSGERDSAVAREKESRTRERAAAERERAAVERERAAAGRERAAVERERAAAGRERAALEREIEIRKSLSWRLTAPLRSAGRLLGRKA